MCAHLSAILSSWDADSESLAFRVDVPWLDLPSDTLLRYEMWDEIISSSQTVYLEPTTIPEEQAKRLAAVGVAHYALGQAENG